MNSVLQGHFILWICIQFSQNLLEKPEEREIVQDHALSMVQCKVLKQLQLLEGRKFDDPDITEDIEYLNETLQTSVQDLRCSNNELTSFSLLLCKLLKRLLSAAIVRIKNVVPFKNILN